MSRGDIMENFYDVIILGGGPAGLTAGIYLSRAKYSVLIVDEGTIGGQVIMSHKIANYPGVEEVTGYRLARTMKQQAMEFGCEILPNTRVTGTELDAAIKSLEVEGGSTYSSRSIIIATGGRPRTLGLESEERFRGKGISYCATCDGDFFRDQDILVVGGGNSALEEAVSLTQYARTVTIAHQFDHFQAYPHAVDEARLNEKITFIMESEVVDFLGGERLEGAAIKNKRTGEKRTIAVSGAFIFIGYVPSSDRFSGIIKLNEYGEILANEALETNLAGVFVAGDVRQKKVRQITTAVSDGSRAAISAIDFLRAIDSPRETETPVMQAALFR
jgi:thioredoxin reductase (NADPH)